MTLQLWKADEQVAILGQERTLNFSARELLLSVLPMHLPADNFTLGQMRCQFQLIDMLEIATDESAITLTKDQAELLESRMSNSTFPVASKHIVDLHSKISELCQQ